MSKNKNLPFNDFGYGEGYVISGLYAVDNLQGRLLTLIESLGLKDTQEKAAKDIVKMEVWRWWQEMSTFISKEEHTNLRKVIDARLSSGGVQFGMPPTFKPSHLN